MKKTGMVIYASVFISALMLSACGQAASAITGPGASADGQNGTTGSNSAAGGSASSATGNCAILSMDEVGAILGETVSEVRDLTNHTICAYHTQNMILEVNFLKTGGLTAAQYMDTIRSAHPDFVAVTGLGDDALYHGSSYVILDVRTGDKVNTLGLRSDDASTIVISVADAQAKELAVAQLLVTRLR